MGVEPGSPGRAKLLLSRERGDAITRWSGSAGASPRAVNMMVVLVEHVSDMPVLSRASVERVKDCLVKSLPTASSKCGGRKKLNKRKKEEPSPFAFFEVLAAISSV